MSTRPRITFNSNGICNACEWTEEKKKLDWNKRLEIFKTEIGIPGVTEDMGTWYYGENLNVTSIQALLTQIENSKIGKKIFNQ